MNLIPNIADYQNAANGAGGFDISNVTQEQLAEISKALEAGQITGRDTTNLTNASGAPLKIESLDKTLKIVTFKESEIQLWKSIPKSQAYNTVEEFNQLTSYGQDRGGFNLEGELPAEEDSQYVRRAQFVKFLGVTKSVTHPMTLVNSMVSNVVQREVTNGTMWILRKLNRALTSANSLLIPQEFNGLYAQHERPDGAIYQGGSLSNYLSSEIVVDLRGSILKEEHIEAASEGIVENFGFGDTLFAPPRVLSNFVKGFYGKKLIQPNTEQVSAGIMGQRVTAHDTQFGRISLNYDIFMNKRASKVIGVAATNIKAPTAPVAVDGVAPVASDALGKWGAGDAGNYFYAVSAFNRHGESTITLIEAAVAAIVAGGAVDLTFTAGVGGEPATGYTVYRGQKNAVASAGTKFYPLFDISVADLAAGYEGAAAGSVRDRNHFLPNCDQAFLVEMSEEVLSFRQLAPLMKMDLAIISPAYRFMVMMYGTPMLFAPRKKIRFINIGDVIS